MGDVIDRIIYTIDFMKSVTGLENIGPYLTAIAEIDMIFLNEDRHFNNLSVIRNEAKEFGFSPVFDNGLSFLADTSLDYPMGINVYDAIPKVSAKPFSSDFNAQTEALEELYGIQFVIHAEKRDIQAIINSLKEYYPEEIISRVSDIVFEQMRRYSVYFKK